MSIFKHEIKLDPKVWGNEPMKASMREGFGLGLLRAAELNRNIVGLCADLVESTQMIQFRNKFKDRFFELGVAEQNLATVASGFAAMGKVPFMASYAVFSPGRNWEQIRTTICYNNVAVKIVGSHAGLSVGPDGGSHQALEDIALMRTLPRMVVISPCDALEAKKATMQIALTKDPTYLRLSRERTAVITTIETPFEIGKAEIFFKPTGPAQVGIIATGPILYKALRVAQKFADEGKMVSVLNLSTIKPLDEQAIIRLAHEARAIVTVEEHQVAGGMGSAVAEMLAEHFPVPIEFVGVKDKFGQSGQPEELFEYYEMAEPHITRAVHRVMIRK